MPKLLILTTFIVVSGVALCVSLGVWQLQRLAWKEALLSSITTDVIPTASLTNTKEFSKVKLSGQFLHEHELQITPRTYKGRVGSHILTPFLANGKLIFVNRGWVQDGISDIKRPKGEVEVLGIVRLQEQTRFWTPKNNPKANKWHFINIEQMAARVQKPMLPFYVQMDFDTGSESDSYPIPSRLAETISNNHLQYSITWFSLAFLLVVTYIFYIRSRHWEK